MSTPTEPTRDPNLDVDTQAMEYGSDPAFPAGGLPDAALGADDELTPSNADDEKS